ncbi:MAG: hypothetical protein FK733_05315 [Asgard group archaeon]|nr:hypothetical protein [Asgard group archaeon]
MAQREERTRFELKPTGLEGLLFLTVLVLILLASLVYIAITYGGKVFYMSIPFVFLLGLWILFYLPYKLYLHFTHSVDMVVFDEKGISIQNKKIEIYEYYPWTQVTDLFVNKKDHDEKPEEFTFITTEKVQTVSLTLYNTIFTSKEALWEKINSIYTKFGEASSE